MNRIILSCALSCATLLATIAQADPAPKADPIAADALFQSALEARSKGDWTTACSKFDASLALDASPSAALNVAKCREHEGKLATAWSAYQRALALNRETKGEQRRKDLEDYTQRAISALEPRLPRLTVLLEGARAGAALTRDGLEIPAAAFGEAVPVDPGSHELVLLVDGRPLDRKVAVLGEGQRERLSFVVPKLVQPSVAAAAPGKMSHALSAAAPKAGAQSTPAFAWVALAAGVGLVGGGIAFRVDQSSAEGALQRHCGASLNACPDPRVYNPTSDNARKNRDAALFVGFASGGALALGAAAFSFLTTRRLGAAAAFAPSVWASPGASGVQARGVF